MSNLGSSPRTTSSSSPDWPGFFTRETPGEAKITTKWMSTAPLSVVQASARRTPDGGFHSQEVEALKPNPANSAPFKPSKRNWRVQGGRWTLWYMATIRTAKGVQAGEPLTEIRSPAQAMIHLSEMIQASAIGKSAKCCCSPRGYFRLANRGDARLEGTSQKLLSRFVCSSSIASFPVPPFMSTQVGGRQ
jgi:hypothetical protein